jgi:hypothetical protein
MGTSQFDATVLPDQKTGGWAVGPSAQGTQQSRRFGIIKRSSLTLTSASQNREDGHLTIRKFRPRRRLRERL